MKIVVTGCSGFIGGQIMLALHDANINYFGIDWVPLPKGLAICNPNFHQLEYSSNEAMMEMRKYQPTAIIHCAGTSLVGPSITDPRSYYNNNVMGTLKLINMMISALPNTRLVFSSSAAVYGNLIDNPYTEMSACSPCSPYGESKHMIEQMLTSYNKAYGLDAVSLRYFNVCGADHLGRHGQLPDATHIIARVLHAIKNNQTFVCNGNSYPTLDGTCIRDYVHVEDIVSANLAAIETTVPAGIYNISNENTMASNLRIIHTAMEITDQFLDVKFGPGRAGDPSSLTGDSTKFRRVANWVPKYDLDDMITHAWNRIKPQAQA